MSNTVTLNVDFPPRGFQIVSRAGTLTGVQVPQPRLGMPSANGTPSGLFGTGTAPLRVQFFDTASGSLNTPIASVNLDNGYLPQAFNVSFSNGLYALATTPSAIAVTYS